MSSTPQQSQNISIPDLRSDLKGEVIGPDDAAYDEARQVVFKGVDRRPAAVARVAGAQDVARVITLARESGLELAVRSGGHSRAGYGTSEGGIVIDLSGMRALDIAPDLKSAWVETGMTAGEYTTAVGERGRATGLGDTGSVGIGGITLAGGIGFLVRKYGLTIDDLLGAEVVTADGEIVQASEESEPDLFWAIRGGEGNFGVATRLQLRLHEISQIVGGMVILPATPEVITGFIEAAEAAPEELSTIANVMLAPPMPFIPEDAHGKPVLLGLLADVGPVDQAEACWRRSGRSASPTPTWCGRSATQRYTRVRGPWFGMRRDQLLRRCPRADGRGDDPRAAPPVDGDDEGRPAAGAWRGLARVPNDATPFAHRDRGLFVNIAAMFMDPDEKDTHDAWVAGLADSLGKDEAGGYVGFLGEEDEGTVRAAYPGPTWDRLRELKRRYDPDNLFRLNHNIPPADG